MRVYKLRVEGQKSVRAETNESNEQGQNEVELVSSVAIGKSAEEWLRKDGYERQHHE